MIRASGHVLGLLPAVYLVASAIIFGLGANPIEWLTRNTGKWALILLLASLAITPVVKRVAKIRLGPWPVNCKKLMPWRRLLGLYAFVYALAHFCIYLVFDLSFDFSFLWADIKDRPYITVGFLAFIILLSLALTSSNYSRKKLGRHWVTLHKSVYVADFLVLLHFFWLIKADFYRFWWYAAVYVVLMGLRYLPPKR
ncbi:MAG TPA: protein-methionine-sulfoxide reductase heme-binding subunit MsrQ [Marinagarivorans sp.]